MNKERKVVGYVRSYKNSGNDCEIATMVINRYALSRGFGMPEMYIDRRSYDRRNRKDLDRANRLGAGFTRNSQCFRSWEGMLMAAMDEEIGIIIVDRRERLYSNLQERLLLETIIKSYDIQILEAEYPEWPEEAGIKKVAFYHYFVPNTRGRGIRTANLLIDIGSFYDVIAANKGWKPAGLYVDRSACKRSEFSKLWDRYDLDIIICKYFYHLNRKTFTFVRLVQEMSVKGITIMSTEEGVIHYESTGGELLKKKLNVATYDCLTDKIETGIQGITRKRMDLFCKTGTVGWHTIDHYADKNTVGTAFDKMVSKAETYDLVIVDAFAKMGESVNELMRSMRKLDRPVYSLREGLLYIYGKNEKK